MSYWVSCVTIKCDRCEHQINLAVDGAKDLVGAIKNKLIEKHWAEINGEVLCADCREEMEHECGQVAEYEYFWPGEERHCYTCEDHLRSVIQIALVMGFRLQYRKLTDEKFTCRQQVTK